MEPVKVRDPTIFTILVPEFTVPAVYDQLAFVVIALAAILNVPPVCENGPLRVKALPFSVTVPAPIVRPVAPRVIAPP